jgi:hypothetical protein
MLESCHLGDPQSLAQPAGGTWAGGFEMIEDAFASGHKVNAIK